ncbi:MAG: hypothetical protein ABC595_03815 [Candidatus Methanosuratincola petrocarbonis]
MDLVELQNDILPCLEKSIKFSFLNGLNIHTPIGGKFAELYVASELWKFEPKLGQQRGSVGVSRPGSCDIVLAKTRKKLEVKWAMCHHGQDDPFFNKCRIPFWGWGFSSGKQFKDKKFDYCILVAAEKDGAYPEHVFVIKSEEMTEETMGGPRSSGVNSRSFYLEFSHDKNFYDKRPWPKDDKRPEHKKCSPLEKDLFKNREKYEKRWEELKERGTL